MLFNIHPWDILQSSRGESIRYRLWKNRPPDARLLNKITALEFSDETIEFLRRETDRTINWFLLCFVAVEIGAAVLYLVGDRRSRADADRLRKELHQMNEKTDH